jgi:hypothetical protein
MKNTKTDEKIEWLWDGLFVPCIVWIFNEGFALLVTEDGSWMLFCTY